MDEKQKNELTMNEGEERGEMGGMGKSGKLNGEENERRIGPKCKKGEEEAM
jgi:hypothetical protein